MQLGDCDITEAAIDDAEAILDLQKLAFARPAKLHGDCSLPPLLDTLSDIRVRFQDHLFLKAACDGRIVGSVRALKRGETCFIGRLIVHPSVQGRGLGTRLMHAIEARFSDAPRFEIFTGHKDEATIRLYERLGYRELRREPAGDKVILVFMEKRAEAAGA